MDLMRHHRFSILLAVFLTSASAAVSGAASGERALPGEACATPAHSKWTEAEKWVWKRVCVGEIADLNLRYGKTLDPKIPEDWTSERDLRPEFLETILLHEPYRGALKRPGVRVLGARFIHAIDLQNANIAHDLWLGYCRFQKEVNLMGAVVKEVLNLQGSVFEESVNLSIIKVEGGLYLHGGAQFGDLVLERARLGDPVDMSGSSFSGNVSFRAARVDGNLEMQGSTFSGTLTMESLQVERHLYMHGGAQFGVVNLRGARVGGQLAMSSSTFAGELDMDRLQVKENLFMHGGAQFGDVYLRGVRVGGQFVMIDSTFDGILDMDSLQVESYLLMRGARFGTVDLRHARVGSNLELDGAILKGKLGMDSLQVGASLFFRGAAEFRGGIDLISAEVGGDLILSGGEFGPVDFTATRVKGDLILASESLSLPRWRDDAHLDLRNAAVGAIQDRIAGKADAWPKSVQLNGFTYERLGGVGDAEKESDLARRESAWFVDWLSRDPTYSPQPYEQLARVLRESGQISEAYDVLYAGRERERRQTLGLERVGLELLRATIGYGYGVRYFRALLWVAAFVVLGVLVLRFSGEGRRNHMPWGIAFSLDMLLPIIRLRDYHYNKVELQGWVRYYFYAHKIMGYVLASFLIAGLAGLTQ